MIKQCEQFFQVKSINCSKIHSYTCFISLENVSNLIEVPIRYMYVFSYSRFVMCTTFSLFYSKYECVLCTPESVDMLLFVCIPISMSMCLSSHPNSLSFFYFLSLSLLRSYCESNWRIFSWRNSLFLFRFRTETNPIHFNVMINSVTNIL